MNVSKVSEHRRAANGWKLASIPALRYCLCSASLECCVQPLKQVDSNGGREDFGDKVQKAIRVSITATVDIFRFDCLECYSSPYFVKEERGFLQQNSAEPLEKFR